MIDDSFFETFAHYASGVATMSFAFWTVKLYKWRKRNRMTFLLFLSIAYIALGFLKDIIFLLPWQNFGNPSCVEDLVSIFDLCFVPLVCAFFFETTRPGIVTNRRLALSFLLFMALFPLYCIFQSKWVLIASYLISVLFTVFTLLLVPINVARYDKFISNNYSYTKDISVGWCVGCVFGFFLFVVFYELCFYEPTWFGEMIYDIGFVAIWNIVCLMSRNHRVVVGVMAFSTENLSDKCVENTLLTTSNDNQKNEEIETVHYVSAVSNHSTLNLDITTSAFIANSLQKCMEENKLYLNPKLSLADLAAAVGTNKTYISNYINGLNKTFYDFINEYRVAEACHIIAERGREGRLTMADVASRSGFNSTSSFNRYFSKIMGVTPSNYSRL